MWINPPLKIVPSKQTNHSQLFVWQKPQRAAVTSECLTLSCHQINNNDLFFSCVCVTLWPVGAVEVLGAGLLVASLDLSVVVVCVVVVVWAVVVDAVVSEASTEEERQEKFRFSTVYASKWSFILKVLCSQVKSHVHEPQVCRPMRWAVPLKRAKQYETNRHFKNLTWRVFSGGHVKLWWKKCWKWAGK